MGAVLRRWAEACSDEQNRKRFLEALPASNAGSLPWYFALNFPGDGTANAIRESLAPAEGRRDSQIPGRVGGIDFDWWLGREALVLNPGRPLAEPEAFERWKAFLRELREVRPVLIQGILLTVAATTILEANEQLRVLFRDQVRRAADGMELDLPVYLIVTKFGLIHGFGRFFAELADRGRPLGFSLDGTLDGFAACSSELVRKLESDATRSSGTNR